MQKRQRVSREAKGFGSRWVQIPIPDPSKYGSSPEQSDEKSAVFDIERRMDTIPNPSPAAMQWVRRVEVFSAMISEGKPSLGAALQARTSSEEPRCSKQERVTDAQNKSTTMLGQYTVNSSSMQSFEWVDHDAILQPDHTHFRSAEKIASAAQSDLVLDSYFTWKSEVSEEEAQALQMLLELAEQNKRTVPPS